MQRFNSKNSVESIGSSKTTLKAINATHMIIQRLDDNRIFLLPETSLVNASTARSKQNDQATFKLDKNDRKQHRGTILLIGLLIIEVKPAS
jgi:hypothetical protein